MLKMDTLLYNGRIYTMEAEGKTVQAIGIENGKIVFIGSDADAEKLSAVNRIDLQGRTVLPGFIEGHMHLASYGHIYHHLTLFHCRSVEECLEEIRRYQTAHPKAAYVFARGWNEDYFTEKRYPTREELDAVCPDVPVELVRVCGHMSVCNSCAIEKIDQLPQAAAFRDVDQIVDGFLYENAIELFDAILPEPTLEEVEEMLLYAMKDLNQCGITTCQTDDFGAIAGAGWDRIIEAYKDLEARGLMTVRVYEQCLFTQQRQFEEFLAAGHRTGQGEEYFKIGPLKLLQDGSLGAKTALLTKPYKDSDDCGIAIFTQDELDSIIGLAHRSDMQIAVHCIGDGAMNMVLDSLEKSQRLWPRPDCRHGIVHVQLSTRKILERMAANDMIAYIQPVFVDYDMDMVPQRVAGPFEDIYAWKTMEDLGILTVGGSDAPVESFDVINNWYYAVTREHLKGGPEGGWLPEQKVSAYQAVSMFTTHGAKACFQESEIGRLLLGMKADLVVLSADPFVVEGHEIRNIRVEMTMVSGRVVYSNEAEL